MYIKGSVHGPAGPVNAIPLSKMVWHRHTTIFSQSHALGTGFMSSVFFPGINFIWHIFFRCHTFCTCTYVRINVRTHQFTKHPQLLAFAKYQCKLNERG